MLDLTQVMDLEEWNDSQEAVVCELMTFVVKSAIVRI